MVDSAYIFEANSENFHELVIEKSQETLVLVDFWADWCQPCQMLMPVLTKMVEQGAGAFVLVKVNSDENQELSAQFGVRSLPTVKLFKNGEIVDEFMGVQPEPAIQAILDKHRVRQGEGQRQLALQQFHEGDFESAEQNLRLVLDAEPDFHDAAFDLACVMVEAGKYDDADIILQGIKGSVDESKLESLQKQIQRGRMQQESGDIESLKQQVADNPDDMQAMLDLAKAYVISGDEASIKAGMDLYLDAIKKDRSFGDDAARKGLLQCFDLFDKDNPLIKEYRAKLYSALY